jgi:hypothetical protein
VEPVSRRPEPAEGKRACEVRAIKRINVGEPGQVKPADAPTGCGKTYLLMKNLSAPCDKTGLLP